MIYSSVAPSKYWLCSFSSQTLESLPHPYYSLELQKAISELLVLLLTVLTQIIWYFCYQSLLLRGDTIAAYKVARGVVEA